MSFSFLPGPTPADVRDAGAEAANGGPEPTWVSTVERRLMARVDDWLSVELDDRVIRIVEDKLRDETERRAWRRGTGVY